MRNVVAVNHPETGLFKTGRNLSVLWVSSVEIFEQKTFFWRERSESWPTPRLR